MNPHPVIRHLPDPDHPGWHLWPLPDDGRFHHVLGRLIVRPDGPRRGRCRMWVEDRHLNLGGMLHGGAILTFVDMAVFAGGWAAGADTAAAVTLDCTAQFVSAGRPEAALDAEVELIRETRRLAFFRGLVVQSEAIVASFSATLRKSPRQP
jgi:uncharacterized protein (TIGR00369 family)